MICDPVAQFGQIDIYLFDQILRGRITSSMRVVDAGCGSGRNLLYFLRSGFDLWGVDSQPETIRDVQRLVAAIAPAVPESNFRVEQVESMTFPDAFADVVLSSAVLHFAADTAQWRAMVESMWRVLKPGGLLFCRLASTIGIENRVRPLGERRFLLPDGSERYLVDEPILLDTTRRLGATLVDPLKTTIVQDQRSMTTWVVRKAP